MKSTEDPTEKQPDSKVPWEQIEQGVHAIVPVEGGNTDAKRGVITTPEGKKIFVKMGIDERTKGWATKEIGAYAFLAEQHYPYAPRLLSTNADNTGFAMDAFLPENGWDWSDTWTKERLDATLVAMDALAAINPDPKYAELLRPVITDGDNGWAKVLAAPEQQAALAAKLQELSALDVLSDLHSYAERAAAYRVRHDMLVHDDVRADNAPWNKEKKEVKLVDWNWLELGDRRLDLAASLVHVHKSGFDVLKDYADRLDPDALNWMAGFWLQAGSQPIWPGGPEKLRGTQFRAGLTALELVRQLRSTV